MNAALSGYGKMGRAIEAVLVARGHSVVAKGGRETTPIAFAEADVVFEFTTPDAAAANVQALLSSRKPIVSGTTGWDTSAVIASATELSIPFLHASNFSIGVAVMRRAAAFIASALAPFPEFEAGLLERHHSLKKDAPSGTAKTLAAAVESAGKRTPVVSLRQGGQPGEHALFFEGPDESLELVHRARSRALFAAGAVAAAEWLITSGARGPVTFDDFLESVGRDAGGRSVVAPPAPPGGVRRTS